MLNLLYKLNVKRKLYIKLLFKKKIIFILRFRHGKYEYIYNNACLGSPKFIAHEVLKLFLI